MGVVSDQVDRGGDHTVDRSDGTSAACYWAIASARLWGWRRLDDLVSSEEDSIGQGEEGLSQDQ